MVTGCQRTGDRKENGNEKKNEKEIEEILSEFALKEEILIPSFSTDRGQ